MLGHDHLRRIENNLQSLREDHAGWREETRRQRDYEARMFRNHMDAVEQLAQTRAEYHARLEHNPPTRPGPQGPVLPQEVIRQLTSHT